MQFSDYVRKNTAMWNQSWSALVATTVATITLCSSISFAAELNIIQNQLPVTLGQYLDYLEDPGRELTIDDIIDGEFDWIRSTQSIPTLGLSESAYWFYIVLTVAELADKNLVLRLDAPTLDRVEFYFVRNSRVIQESIVGDTIAFSQLDHPYRIPVVSFQLGDTGEETRIYFRATSGFGIEIPLTLTTMSLLALEQQGQLSFYGAFFAFFFLCFSTCSILYYVLRDKQFLGYTLFFGGCTVLLLTQSGIGRVWFWGDFPQFNNRLNYVSATVLIASCCLLSQSLRLNSRYRDPAILILRFVAFSMLPAALYFLIIPFERISGSNVQVIMYLGMIVALTIIVMAGVSAIQGSRSALYLFCSLTMLILTLASQFSYKFNFVERGASSSIFSTSLLSLAALMLMVSLAEFIRSKNEQFAQARLETRAKGDFLRNVSREFLTPVHLILANSKRLMAAQSNKLDEPTRKHMTTVIKQSDHLHNLINDLLEMAELESENFEPVFELVEMTHFLTEVKDMLSPSAKEKGLELTTHFASANLLVHTDKSRLQHALINLITNSIKFTDHGKILLGYKAVYFRRRLGIEIFLQDTGRGMSEEFQKRLFQEFSREEVSEKEPEGTGLGLVIVKRMIEKLGGEITFESQKDVGSQFFIRLPLRVSTH